MVVYKCTHRQRQILLASTKKKTDSACSVLNLTSPTTSMSRLSIGNVLWLFFFVEFEMCLFFFFL